MAIVRQIIEDEAGYAREHMVSSQLMPGGVIDEDVLSAMRKIPRERFVPPTKRGFAYVDEDISIEHGRYMMAPLAMGRLFQAARINKADLVLEIGCGTGYGAAVLGKLASLVVSIDSEGDFIEDTAMALRQLEIDNVSLYQAHMPGGYIRQAPYDVIFINGAIEGDVPMPLIGQLGEGGRMVLIRAVSDHLGQAWLYEKKHDHFSGRPLFEETVSVLPGFTQKHQFKF